MKDGLRLYGQMFMTFFKIGAFTLGGGYAMIPLVRDEVVDRRKWIEEEEFLNMLALAQSAPGVMAVNTAVFIGYRMRGLRGVLCTVAGSVLPSFVIILLIAAVFTRFREYAAVEAVFKGIRPAVVALIAAPLYKMARSAGMMKSFRRTDTTENALSFRETLCSWLLLLVPAAVALLIWLADVSPVLIIACTVAGVLSVVWFKERRGV